MYSASNSQDDLKYGALERVRFMYEEIRVSGVALPECVVFLAPTFDDAQLKSCVSLCKFASETEARMAANLFYDQGASAPPFLSDRGTFVIVNRRKSDSVKLEF